NITVKVADPVGLKVTRDGIDVGRGQWNSPVPIDPGEHRVTASAPGKRTWERAVHVPPEPKTVAVEIPALNEEPSGETVAIGGAGAAGVGATANGGTFGGAPSGTPAPRTAAPPPYGPAGGPRGSTGTTVTTSAEGN